MSRLRLAAAAAALLPLGSLGAAWLAAPGLYRDDLATPFPHRESAWAGSTTCESCHPDHYASWHRTFHHTMTQEATPESVVGAFDGQRLTFGFKDPAGNLVTARPVRRGDEFFIEYIDSEGGVFRTLQVLRTVGSRRYQQYLVQAPTATADRNYFRIPLVWHIGEKRWIHLNGAFLGHDDEPYDSHLTIWNQNCIFCHNTGPQPGIRNYDDMMERAKRGEQVATEWEGQYVSKVAELGISCESCHAPSAEHARRNRNPLRRYLLHLQGDDDPTVVHPEKLSKERSVEVCGQCHGQRLPNPPDSIRDWLVSGPVYRAGEDLTASVAKVTIDTPGPPDRPDLFSRRFWPDGTPRLTAYEYQGITSSPCYLEGELTCNSCHTMHGGDRRGMIQPEMRTNEACAGCHAELVANPKAHTFHEADGSGSLCYECHMPKMVYGVLEIHRSHHIENPDPAADAEAARPDACTGCHVDKSAVWAAEKSREWWGGVERIAAGPDDPELTETVEKYRLPTHRGDGAPVDLLETTAALFAGDPVQRAVAARLAGRRDTGMEIEKRAFLVPLLLQGLDDHYPTIRWFSRQSLRDLLAEMPVPGMAEALESFDYIAPAPQRQVVLDHLRQSWAGFAKDHLPPPPAGSLVDERYELLAEEAAPLLALQANKLIHVGE